MNGLMHRSKQHHYSITSSASNCIELGTLKPSALSGRLTEGLLLWRSQLADFLKPALDK
jgi:hypothetical protein